MAELIRAHDWSKTPLGPIEGWPQSLKTAVGIMLTTRHPVFIFWGPELICLYNEAYARSLGPEKHPSILGVPAPEAFAEAYPLVAAELAQVMAGGEATWQENNLVPIERHGRVEEVYWTYSYGPIHDADAPNGVGGVLTFITETTPSVVAQRESETRYRTLFEAIDEGYLLADVVFDEDGRAVDIEYVEANPAATRMVGTDLTGRRLSDVDPRYEPHWYEIWGRVARTGQGERLERYATPESRWYDFYVFKLRPQETSSRRVAVIFHDITQRKEAEEALRKSEERFRNMADTAPQAFWITDGDGRVEFFNQWWADYSGVPYEPQTAAETAARFIHPDDGPAVMAAFDEARRMGRPFEVEQRNRSAAGEYRWFLNRAAPYRDPATGEITKWFGVGVDISDRKRVEHALRESEERYRAIVEQATAGIAELDAEGRITLINDVFCAILGRSREEMLGRRGFHDLAAPIDRDSSEPLFSQALRKGEAVSAEKRYLRPDGQPVWVSVSLALRRNQQGDVIGGAAAAIDITGRKRAEEQLRVLMEGIPQLVWRAGGAGDWTWASPQWTQYTGQSSGDSRGSGWLDMVHPDDRDAVMARWRKAGEAGEFNIDHRIRHAGEDRYRWFQSRASAVRDEAGSVVEWLGASTDVDELRQLQEEQKVLVSELQHRTRNLLAIVSSISSQTVARSDTLKGFKAQFEDRLAALSRVQGLLSRSEHEPITIGEVIRIELDALGAGALGDRVTIEGPEVPLQSSVVQTLALALHELATNARKYGALKSANGRLTIRWNIRPAKKGPHLALEWMEEGISADREKKGPAARGYGRTLIERALPYSLGAKTNYQLGETELTCTIDLPLEGRDLDEEDWGSRGVRQ